MCTNFKVFLQVENYIIDPCSNFIVFLQMELLCFFRLNTRSCTFLGRLHDVRQHAQLVIIIVLYFRWTTR